MRLPVGLHSLFIQCAAVLPVALLQTFLPNPSPLWQLAFAQGALAALLSLAWRQAAWWPPLHFAFLPAAVLAQQARVPAWVYLLAFLLLVIFYWSSFRSRVPLYLSGRSAWQATASLLPTQPFRFIDLGSGLGGVPLHLESRFPQGDFAGTEVAPAPWLISRTRAWLAGSRVRFMRRDYASLDLGDYDVVFAFLSPAAMPGLWRQAESQMRQGSLFLSLAFTVEGRQPDQVLEPSAGAGHPLYAWRM
jgi:hypothetical protein